MNTYTVKGHEIECKVTKTGFDRKSVVFVNNIVAELKKLGIKRDDIEVKLNVIGNKNYPATLEFWADGHYLRFSYSMTKRFIDNLYIISKLIEIEVNEVLEGKKELYDFYNLFIETENRKDISNEVKQAKLTLGLSEDETDSKIITNSYRKLAREYHPDAGGSIEDFQKVNKAHKLLKKEMGF